MLLGSQSLKRFRFNFRRAAANVTATSGASVALLDFGHRGHGKKKNPTP
jgi:hypothetical protein